MIERFLFNVLALPALLLVVALSLTTATGWLWLPVLFSSLFGPWWGVAGFVVWWLIVAAFATFMEENP